MSQSIRSLDGQPAEVGSIVFFGRYAQTASAKDCTPIAWYVAQCDGTAMLLLSEAILDCKRYHRDFSSTTWRDCDLRSWLNDGFYQTAFSDDEKQRIIPTVCSDNGPGAPDTIDSVYLLSTKQVTELTQVDRAVKRQSCGTEFARMTRSDGCRLYVYDKGKGKDYLLWHGQTVGSSWWWLRTRSDDARRSCFIGTLASVRHYGRVNVPYYGVRPALTVLR